MYSYLHSTNEPTNYTRGCWFCSIAAVVVIFSHEGKIFFLFGHIYTCVRGLDLGVDMFSGYLRSPGAGWSYGVGSQGVTLLFSESATPRLVWNFSESRLDVWKVAFIIVTWDVWEERRSSVNNEQQQATARMQMFNFKVLAVGLNYMSSEEARNGWLGLKLSEVLLCWLRVRWRLEFRERFLTNAFFFAFFQVLRSIFKSYYFAICIA